MKLFYRIWLGLALLGALVILGCFCWGLSDGTVSSFNAGLWLGLVAAALGIPVGGIVLQNRGQRWLSLGLLSFLTVPTLLYAFFILLLLIFEPRWN